MAIKKLEIIRCKDKHAVSEKALNLILGTIDSNTLLLLSGGTSPDLLYKMIAQDRTLKPGAVALIDERFGKPMHDNSNEKMIFNTGLTSYLESAGIPFFRILKDTDMQAASVIYEQIIQSIFKSFFKRVAVMGVGADGHTAGIKPNLEYDHTKFVVGYDDKKGMFGKRITLTFEALEKIDEFIVLVFGENKRNIIDKMSKDGDQQKFPACFYVNSSAKTKLLTDIAG